PRPRNAMSRAFWVVLFASILAAKTYPVDGIVVAVDPQARTMLVAHRPIGKFMGAMMMPFRVERAAELTGLYPGVRIRFDLIVDKSRSIARNVQKAGGPDVEIRPPKEKLRIGETHRHFQLTDQQGRAVRMDGFRGKVLAINFIYTRCPLPDVCPRLSANFATLQ